MNRKPVADDSYRSLKRIAQAVAVVLLACSAMARANDCAGGMDASGNECTGDATGFSEAYTRMLYLKGAVTAGELAVIRAKDRQSAATAGVMTAESDLKLARKALSDAERSTSFNGTVIAGGRPAVGEVASARDGGRAAALRKNVFDERRARFEGTVSERPANGSTRK